VVHGVAGAALAAAPRRDVPPFPHRERVPAADRRATTGDRAAPPPGTFL